MRSARELNAITAGPFAGAAVEAPTGHPDTFTLGGELGRRLARSLHRIVNEPPYCREYLLGQINADPGWWANFPRFHGDMCGRWILAETRAHAAEGRAPAHLATLVAEAITLQRPDGSFGAVASDAEVLHREKAYGNGWMLKGLCAYAQAFRDVAVRSAAIRLGEHYAAMAPLWAAAAEEESATGAYAATISCFYHGLDGIVALARLTGEARWRDLAASFLPHLTPLTKADHSHMCLTIRRGVLALHELRGDQAGIAAVAAEADIVWQRCALETGGMPERFWLPAGSHADDEACTLVDWLLLTCRLHALTGAPRWAERAILCLENQLFYNQTYNGGFGSCELGVVYKQQGKEAPWCCSLAGPAGLITASAGWLRVSGATLTVTHLLSGTFTFLEGQTIVAERDDAAGVYRLDLTAAPGITAVRILQPHWLELRAGAATVTDGHLVVTRSATTTKLEIGVTYRTWSAASGRAPEPTAPGADGSATLFHGPWMLSHHHHDAEGRLPVRLSRKADGAFSGAKVVHLQGLTFAGEGLRVILPTDRAQRSSDVFRGIGEADGEVWTYALKDKESPNQSRTTFVVS
jgi:hypothetical protein